jgi:hypothetical protein
MFYVGLDIHQKRIAICVLSETGQIVRRAQVRTIAAEEDRAGGDGALPGTGDVGVAEAWDGLGGGPRPGR